MWVCFACSPEFAVGNFTTTCCEAAFGKAKLSILKCFLACCSLVFMVSLREMLLLIPECYRCLFAMWWFADNC